MSTTPFISLSEYHAAQAISPSKLKFWRDNEQTPHRYAAKYVHKTLTSEPKGEPFIIGQLSEDLIQRGTPGDEFVAKAFDDYRTKEAKAWRDAVLASGKTIYTNEQYDQASRIMQAVAANPLANQINLSAEQQRTFRVTLAGGVVLQCRPDYWLPAGIDGMSEPCAVDLKTCEDVNQFDGDVFKWGYHWAAHLTRFIAGAELKAAYGVTPEIGYKWIVVDKQPQPVCQVVTCTATHLSVAMTELEEEGLLHRLIARYRSGDWETPTQREAIAPKWAQRKATT